MVPVLVLTLYNLHWWAFSTSSYIYGTICSIIRCTNTDPNPNLKLIVTVDPEGVKKRHASHYGAHLATYEQLAQYSTCVCGPTSVTTSAFTSMCTCGPDPLLLALVVFSTPN